MRRFSFVYSLLSLTAVFFCSGSLNSAEAAQPKEWTLLVFLNGNNSLDSFGPINLKQMEKIGSTKDINIVVQWASLSTGKVERFLIKKSSNPNEVTSPVVQDLGSTDMGDWHSVVDFVKWGAANYPAKHYFLDIWDHGSGWHGKRGNFGVKDISLDENTGNMITTKQLGLALSASAQAIGQKIDLYASDACLMAMPEIANEMADSVSIYAGSEETEPGLGWPYHTFLARWAAKPNAKASEVAVMLSEEYAKFYDGNHGNSYESVTFSAFDLGALNAFKNTLKTFSENMKKMSGTTAKLVLSAAKNSQSFTDSDYVDFLDFLKNIKSANISSIDNHLVDSMLTSTKNMLLTSNNIGFPNATGLTIWIPKDQSTFNRYLSNYTQLKFDSETHWSDFLSAMLK